MTTIAVQKKDDRICIATDSQATLGGRSTHGIQKLFIKKPFALAICGELRIANIIENSFFYHISREEYQMDAYEFMQTIFLQRFRDAIKINGAGEIINQTKELHGAMVIVVFKGRVFEIGMDFCVTEIESYTALGSGGDYAIGALTLMTNLLEYDDDEEEDISNNVIQAVNVAVQHDIYSGGDIQLFDSDSHNMIPEDDFFDQAEEIYDELDAQFAQGQK